MLINQENFVGIYPVQAYEAGQLKINNTWLNHSIKLCCGLLPEAWILTQIADLNETLLNELIISKPEVILLGSGPTLQFPARSLLQAAMINKIGIEVMDSAAACRTYNLLLAEGRKVVAGIIV